MAGFYDEKNTRRPNTKEAKKPCCASCAIAAKPGGFNPPCEHAGKNADGDPGTKAKPCSVCSR